MVNPDELEIRLFVPLRHVKAIQPDHVVDVTADRSEFTATVSSMVPAGDPRSQSFEVLVKAPAVDGLLAAGNTVQVRLPLGQPQRRLSVPRDALIIRADGDWIAVDGSLRAGDNIVVGVFEGEARRVTAERVKPAA
ncbi:MAG: HlyD family efflux transporter periplasmic adaptor subunit [Steroidobacteraceae bacterium]